jgi:hypothetical protein
LGHASIEETERYSPLSRDISKDAVQSHGSRTATDERGPARPGHARPTRLG